MALMERPGDRERTKPRDVEYSLKGYTVDELLDLRNSYKKNGLGLILIDEELKRRYT